MVKTCCDKPSLKFNWMLGANENRLVLDINSVRCDSCGVMFRFDGLVATSDNRRGITLEIAKEYVQ